MSLLMLLCSFAFILVYWVTAWAFFKTLATIFVVVAIVVIASSWIKNIFT